MRPTYPFEEISGWLTAPEDRQAALDTQVKADVVIIGGGYTGLSTALVLRERGMDVAILEQGFAGSGASGRNAGHLAPTIGKDIPSLLRFFGAEKAKKLMAYADTAVNYTEKVINRHGIECEYEPNGNIVVGVHPKHEDGLRKAADTAQSLGGNVRFMDGNEMRQRQLPRAFTCGILEERGGILNPGKYVLGLRRAALNAGVRIYEDSKLTSLENGSTVTAITSKGSISAGKAVLATNAYTKSTGWHKRTVTPIRATLFETKPLSDAQLATLGWKFREGVYTAHQTLESFRLTARNTIVGGTKKVSYAYGSALANGYNEQVFQTIEGAFRARFPELTDVEIAQWWGGWFGLTLDFLPMIGVSGDHHNVYHGFGYAGHGVPQATMMGSMLADKIEGIENPWEQVLDRRHLNWPPEPLRWLGVKALTLTFNAMDKRTDRQIRELGVRGCH
ncbi:MAG: FAD-dependent oxidoreductase [Gammaproteobacteria bacterium]|nr:FAD-dependent oxidoreductase [Gammaproteobacteria bacterium]